jgi:hypothetical protein
MGFSDELLIFVKNMYCVESSASIYLSWVQIKGNKQNNKDLRSLFEEDYDRSVEYVTKDIRKAINNE